MPRQKRKPACGPVRTENTEMDQAVMPDGGPGEAPPRQCQDRDSWADRLKVCIEAGGGPEELEELLWETLRAFQGEDFTTAKGLNFCYSIRGNEMFVDRKEKSITRASVSLSFQKALEVQREWNCVSGPKKLGTFGASYLYPIFLELGVIRRTPLV